MAEKKKRSYGTGSLRQRSETSWELKYYVPGETKPRRETVKAANQKAAERELRDRLKKLDDRRIGPRVSLSRLFDLHIADLRRHGHDTLIPLMRINKHLKDRFGARESSSIGKPDITEYMDDRMAAGAKKATINRELSIIRRALNLGVEHGMIPMSPFIEQFDESDNVRQGFIEYEDYLRIMRNLPRHQHMLWCFAYHLGIRKGELLKLRWEWLLPYWNEEKPIIKVPGELCKNKKPHTIPIYGDMIHFVEIAIAERDPNCPWIFQYRGKRLKNVREGFEAARDAAGLPKVLFHDTRRTAIRNMEQAGIPRAEAMQISGHRTEAVYKRYDIASERGARAAGERLEEFHRKVRENASTQNKLGANLGADLDGKGEGSTASLPSKYKN